MSEKPYFEEATELEKRAVVAFKRRLKAIGDDGQRVMRRLIVWAEKAERRALNGDLTGALDAGVVPPSIACEAAPPELLDRLILHGFLQPRRAGAFAIVDWQATEQKRGRAERAA